MTHVAAHVLSYENLVDSDELDHNGVPNVSSDSFDIANESLDPFNHPFNLTNKSHDPGNIANTDAFKELAQNQTCFAMITPNQSTLNELQDMADVPEQLPNDMEVGNTEVVPTVVIDHFPSASAGAPIDGMPHGPTKGHMRPYKIPLARPRRAQGIHVVSGLESPLE